MLACMLLRSASSKGICAHSAAGALMGTPILGALADAASNKWALAAHVVTAGLVYTFFGLTAREVANLRSSSKDMELGITAHGSSSRLQPAVNGLAVDKERAEGETSSRAASSVRSRSTETVHYGSEQ